MTYSKWSFEKWQLYFVHVWPVRKASPSLWGLWCIGVIKHRCQRDIRQLHVINTCIISNSKFGHKKNMWPLSTFQFCDHENSQQQNKTCRQVCDLDTTWYNMRYFAPLTNYNKMSIWSKISCCFLCLYFFYLWLSGSGFYKNWSMVSEWSVDQWWLIVQSARQKVINRKIREFCRKFGMH